MPEIYEPLQPTSLGPITENHPAVSSFTSEALLESAHFAPSPPPTPRSKLSHPSAEPLLRAGISPLPPHLHGGPLSSFLKIHMIMPLPCSENVDDFPLLLGIKSKIPLHGLGDLHYVTPPTSLALSPSSSPFAYYSHGDLLTDGQELYVSSSFKAFTCPTPPSKLHLSSVTSPIIISYKSYAAVRE